MMHFITFCQIFYISFCKFWYLCVVTIKTIFPQLFTSHALVSMTPSLPQVHEIPLPLWVREDEAVQPGGAPVRHRRQQARGAAVLLRHLRGHGAAPPPPPTEPTVSPEPTEPTEPPQSSTATTAQRQRERRFSSAGTAGLSLGWVGTPWHSGGRRPSSGIRRGLRLFIYSILSYFFLPCTCLSID